MNLIRTIITLFAIPITLIGCGTIDSQNEDSDFTIYTTIYPIQYITERMAGDVAHIKTVYPPGVDAHTYEPTSGEMTEVAEADALIYLGAGMESFIDTIRNALDTQDIHFVELGAHEELFSPSDEHHHHAHDDHAHDDHAHGDVDPHIWLDPLRMIALGEIILNTLIELEPTHEADFQAQFDLFEADMLALDQSYLDSLNESAQKDILVAHAAYGYWEERYGITQIPIRGLNAESEPSQQALTHIVDEAKEKNLRYVIFEQNGSDRIVNIMKDHLDAEALYIHNLEVLTDEDLDNEEDYMTLMQSNLQVLKQAIDR